MRNLLPKATEVRINKFLIWFISSVRGGEYPIFVKLLQESFIANLRGQHQMTSSPLIHGSLNAWQELLDPSTWDIWTGRV